MLADMAYYTSPQQINDIVIDTQDPIYQDLLSPNQYVDLHDVSSVDPTDKQRQLFSSEDDLPPPCSPTLSEMNNTIHYDFENGALTHHMYTNNVQQTQFSSSSKFCKNINSVTYALGNENTSPHWDSLTFNDTTSEHVMPVREVQRSNEQDDDQGQSQEARDNDTLGSLIAFLTADRTSQNITIHNNPIAQSNMKKSNLNNTINFNNINNSFYFGPDVELRLTAPPYQHQRGRYEKELDATPRYIFVTDQRTLTLELSDHPDRFASVHGFSCYLQVVRTTVPIENNNNVMFIHPYPLWVNDKDAHVYNNTLLIPIKTQIIKLDRLVMVRAKQNSFKNIRHLNIYSPDELNFIDTHEINANEKSTMIDTYQLRCSIIHFRICMVNQTGTIRLTDLHCETDQIREFAGEDFKDLPEEVRLTQKQSSKRKRLDKSNMDVHQNSKRTALSAIV